MASLRLFSLCFSLGSGFVVVGGEGGGVVVSTGTSGNAEMGGVEGDDGGEDRKRAVRGEVGVVFSSTI